MNDVVIHVENLGKRYRIGQGARGMFRYKSLRETLASAFHRSSVPSLQRPDDFIWALKDVSFEVKRGEVLGIIGRNGVGKSTLLKILSRITEPTEGFAEIRGRVGSLLEVGTGFHPELTGRENIFLNGVILGMKRHEIARKFDEIVAFAEIEKFLDTPVKHYSSGMYVRLAFAVAAHLEPEILLVDEVLAVGDAAFQKKCLGAMEKVGKGGRTILFVSHNMAAIQRLCRHVIHIDAGRIAACGDAMKVTQEYLRGSGATALHWERKTPPSTDAYFVRVFLADIDGQALANVVTGGTTSVVIEFVLKSCPPNLQCGIGLLDANGEVIFASSPPDSGCLVPENPGSYRAHVVLPAEILMPRIYTLRVVLWSPEMGTFDSQDVATFSVQETASLCNSTAGGRLGMLAIKCQWKISTSEAISEQQWNR